MANTLMFEVGIKSAKEQLEKIKQEFKDANGELNKLLNIKVHIDGVEAITNALSQIRDTTQLKNLRQEIENLNREFSKMAVGAGGTGDLGLRAAAQDAAELKSHWQSAERTLQRMKNDLADMRISRDKLPFGSQERNDMRGRIENLKKQVDEQEKVAQAAKEEYKSAASGVDQITQANTRAEASFKELKTDIDKVAQSVKELSGQQLNINLGGEFKTWAQEVLNVTASVRELVEQLQKITTPEGLKTFTETAQSALSRLREEAEKIQNTFGKFSDRADAFKHIQNSIGGGVWFSANGKQIDQIEHAKSLIRTLNDEKVLQKELNELRSKYPAGSLTDQKLSDFRQLERTYVEMINLLRRVREEEEKIGKSSVQVTAKASQQLNQPATQGSIFDTQKFTSLQETIDAIIKEINRLGTAFRNLGENDAFKNFESSVKTLKETMTSLSSITQQNQQTLKTETQAAASTAQGMEGLASAKKNVTDAEKQQSRANEQNAQTLKQEGEQANKTSAFLEKVAKEAQNASDSSKKSGSQQAASVNSLLVKYATLIQRIENWQGVLSKMLNAGGHSNYFDKQIESAIKGYQQLKEILMSISKGEKFNLNGKEFFLDMDYHTLSYLRSVMTYLGVSFANVNKEASLFNKNADKGMRNAAESMRKAGREADNLETKLEKLNIRGVRANAVRAGVDVSGLDAAIARLERYQRVLEYIYNSEGKHDASRIIGSVGYRQANNDLSVQIESVKHLTSEKQKAGDATSRQITEEQKLAQAIGHSTNEMKNQSMVLSDMKSIAYQYLSVWGAQSFINKIIETGGQLEQQRLSLSAILGDMEKANTLFGQVKELALKSPFGVVQIDQMTKQLAAYSFEYEELFDWTKRLADISAATGTSVDRLALALGHVRSEGALSGYTLRQFAMANVPVLRMLSENLGISSKDVRERVRKKEIGADDVQQILKQLTDEGGMFYNAQEVMSQALNAKFKNLRDAFDIMYGEIAESGVGDRLKDLATILTQGAKEWERFGRDILMVGAAFGIGKVAIALYNTALGQNTTSTLKNIAAAQQKENAHLRLAHAAGLVTKAEYNQLIYNERYSASGLKVALVENKLTVEELQRAVALGKVNKAVAQAAVVAAGYDAALISNIKVLGFWRKGIFLLGEGFRAARVAAKGFLASVWPLLALSAVFDLVNRTSQNNDAAKESAQSAAKATNKYQDLQAMTERLGSSQNKTTDQLENNIKAMKESLIATGKYTEELKKQVDSVETLAEKYDILHAAMKRVSDEANDKQSRKQALIEEGLSAGSGTAWLPWNWFRDNALKDAKDIDDYAGDLYLALDKNDRVLRDGFRKILETRRKWQKKFESMSAKDIFMSLDEGLQDDVLYALRWGNDSSKEMQKAGNAVASIMYGSSGQELKNAISYSYKGAFAELENHKEELAKAFADAFRVDYPEIDLSKASPDQKIVFAKWLDETIANLEDVKESGKKALNDIVIRGTIKVRPDYSLDNENWEKFLNDFKEKNPLAYNEWNRHENTGALTEEEKRKSLESYGKTFSGATQNNIGNQAKKQIKELKEERARLVAFEDSIVYKDSKEEQQRTEKRKGEIDEQIKRLKQAQKDYNQYGDPDKNKNKEDKEAKTLRERVRILKEAADSYQYWRQKVGESSAETHMLDEFGQILKEQNLTIKNSDELRAKLKELRAEYSKKPQTKAMVEAIKEIDKELAKLDRKDFEKETEDFLSKVQIELDSLTRAWEIFNDVRASTGDVELAVRISGADYQGGSTRNLADALREKIQKDFDAAGGGIAFNPYLSDKDIQESIQKAMPQASEKQIKGFIEEYKKWRDLQRDVLKADIQTFSQLLGKAEDYESVIARINSNYSVQKESLDNLLNDYLSGKTDEKGNRLGITPDEYLKALGLLDASTDLEKFKQSSDYINLMNNSLGMTANAVEEAADALKIKLGVALKNNAISAKDYADEMAKLEDILKKYDANGLFGKNTAFASYIKGGMQGVIQNYTDKVQARRTELANAGKSEEEIENDALIKKYKKVQDALSKFANGLNSASATIDFFGGILQGFGDAAKQLSDMFDALGDSDAAETMSDIADGIGAITSGAQSLSSGLKSAVNGDVGGLVSGVVGTITSPITAFAMLNDKKHERRIQDLKKEITKIDNTLNTIKALRERELGYDSGSLRRQLAAQYQAQERTISLFGSQMSLTPSVSGMSEYYGRYSGGNGYSQEYNALVETRKKYMEMYEEENAKKKSSSEALEEYKTKIAALDEQIMFFTQDLAKELWSIDIQGWADQIGDALWTAFENGEDAVEAFGDTARDIISNVAKNMWELSVLEPMFNDLQEALFGKNGQRGTGAIKFDSNGNIDMKASEQPTLDVLGQYFGKNGIYQQAIEGGEQFYDWVQKITGIDLSKDSSSSASNSIKGITEQTADLLASYVNAIRADVSVDRGMIADYFPQYLAAMTSGNASLQNIEQNTAAIMRSNDAIQKSVADLYSDIHGLRTTTWKMPIA